MPGTREGLPDLDVRLNTLFVGIPDPHGHRWTNDGAAEAITASGVPVGGSYLAALRSGTRNNPSARLIAAIAALFDVPVTYFFDADEAARIDGQLGLLNALRDAQVRTLIARTTGVSATGIANLTAILEQLRHLEGLDRDV